jgi:hypothetical protein
MDGFAVANFLIAPLRFPSRHLSPITNQQSPLTHHFPKILSSQIKISAILRASCNSRKHEHQAEINAIANCAPACCTISLGT